VRVMLVKEIECALEVGKRVLCIDYLRHGFGRAARRFPTSRSSQE
jgi:hypothetical protein